MCINRKSEIRSDLRGSLEAIVASKPHFHFDGLFLTLIDGSKNGKNVVYAVHAIE